jgi:predicted  nucleic acid-binding Zn-ribbon protein
MATDKKSEVEKKNQAHTEELHEVSVEQKLVALYTLQQIDSQIDKIRIIRGELPLEVQDLEDEVVGLETRIEKLENEVVVLNNLMNEKKQGIKDSKALITKYEEQQKNVRNNREYDSLSKEVEFQNLEIQLCEKRIREHTTSLNEVNGHMDIARAKLTERTADLNLKKSELQSIIEETEKDEQDLMMKSKKSEELIEDRLVVAYKRIRKNARNGLAVVQIERDACGGCFNKIPPQHQLDIRVHKKVIVCEFCGRILVDQEIAALYSK